MTGYYQGRFRDQWEAVAAEIFADELGQSTVTPRTGLRGGTGSAERIAAKLGAATGLQLTADLVRRHDTVHALGSYLRTHARRDLCVQLLPDDRGPRPKLFYVHSASGNAFAIWALRSLLPLPLSGVRAAGLYGERDIPRTIAEFADVYLDEVRDAQPEGPYLLCGFSGGGSIAFELARRLHAQGAHVGLLALIDAPPPVFGSAAVPDESALMEDRLRELLRRVEGRVREHADAGDPEVVDVLQAGDALAKDMGSDALRRQLTVYARLIRACAAYRPARYPGVVHYFAAEATPEHVEQWKPYAGALHTYRLDADHYEYEIFAHPDFREVFAGLTGDALRRAGTGRDAASGNGER
ncbi:hypothetical protein E1295_37945 [Nonomuraea mesophila]|uniref:Thioesterase TesA-like domain-containing protein n=1 Tax=Nonomuraea mesophila TaxID=2530382 RepID=A0A4V2Z6R5_9ACTN|nr:thioesterase domain-containing protein [Nonomuraea mesophila]TDE33616.1 hypothetical protein E1295_37945 [Nonomuraea mesophila]